MTSILKIVLTPLFISLALLLTTIMLTQKQSAHLKKYVLTGFSILFVASLPLVSDSLLWHWEHRAPATNIADINPAGTIILLSGGVAKPDLGRPTSELATSGDRLLATFKLLNTHSALNVWVADNAYCALCGGQVSHTADILQLWGINPRRIIISDATTNTEAELLLFKHYRSNASDDQSAPLILVTSALHMPRAQLVLDKLGLTAALFPANHIAGNTELSLDSFVPTVTALIGTTRVITEMLAYVYVYFNKTASQAMPS